MEFKSARCTNCGAALQLEEDKRVIECGYCHTSVIFEHAVEFANINEQEASQVSRLRENLAFAVQNNNLSEIERTASLIRDMIPKDFRANYYYGYVMDQTKSSAPLYDFYKGDLEGTEKQIEEIISHIIHHGELRDKKIILDFIQKYNPTRAAEYLDVFEEKKEKLDYYDSSIKRDVFVCHRSTDIKVVEQLVDEIEKDGYECWVSYRNLRPNDNRNYWKSIEEAIDNCQLFLSVCSEEAMLSKDVQHELKHAVKLNKKRVEYKVDEANHTRLFKDAFNGIQWVDGTALNAEGKLLDRIHKELQVSPKLSTSKKGLIAALSIIPVLIIGYFIFTSLIDTPTEGIDEPINTEIPETTNNDDTSNTQESTNLEDGKVFVSRDGVAARELFELGEMVPPSYDDYMNEEFVYTSEDAFTVVDGTITNYDTSYGSDIVIPDTISGQVIHTIDNEAFSSKGLTSVVLPETLNYIRWNAFAYNNIQMIVIPPNVRQVESGAFFRSNLEEVAIFSTFVNLEGSPFAENNIIIQNGVLTRGLIFPVLPDNSLDFTKILSYAGSETTVDFIPKEVLSIGRYAFDSSSIKKVILPNNVVSISDGAFLFCRALREVEISSDIYIGEKAFNGSAIEMVNGESHDGIFYSDSIYQGEDIVSYGSDYVSVTIPEGVKVISQGAFAHALTKEYILPSTLEYIGENAFWWNQSLNSITIPASVTFIGTDAFGNTSNLTSVTIEGDETRFNAYWNMIGFPTYQKP